MKIIVELKSDLMPGSGSGFAGVVDSDIEYEANGLPFIPAKRLKGCLRECAEEIRDSDSDTYQAVFDKLFGKPGMERGESLKLGNGYLTQKNADDEFVDIYSAYSAEVDSANLPHSEVLDLFTSLRRQTALDESGQAKSDTLRSKRVINKGQYFEFAVDIPADCADLLDRSCKTLRYMGLNRTRGLGEIKCALVDCGITDNTKDAQDEIAEDAVALGYTLELLEPVIAGSRLGVKDACEEYIFGSTFLGVFASLWCDASPNVNEPEDCDEFRELFLLDKVKFGAAFPADSKRVYYPTSHAIRTDKEKLRFADKSLSHTDKEKRQPSDESLSLTDKAAICKKLGGFAAIEDGIIYRKSVTREVYQHHSRPDDKSIGSATGIGAGGGQFYKYEALSKGQTFKGVIHGDAESLRKLTELFKGREYVSLGRSRTAQYGKARLTLRAMADKAEEITVKPGDSVRLTVRTPAILCDEQGSVRPDIRKLIPEIEKFEICNTFVSETVVCGYNAKWRLPRAQVRALAEGSGIVLTNKSDADITLNGEYFVGQRTGDGFGYVATEKTNNESLSEPKLPENTQATGEKNEGYLSRKIERRRALREAIRKGSADAARFNALNNSNIGRVLEALEQSNDRTQFDEKIKQIKKENIRSKVQAVCEGYLSDDFGLYKAWLNACMVRLKQRNRNEESEGGAANEHE
jgi:CRISPR-associated protein Csx10